MSFNAGPFATTWQRIPPALPFLRFRDMCGRTEGFDHPTKVKTRGDRLKATRMDLALIQKDVAEIIGVTTGTIYYWESNRVTPMRKSRDSVHVCWLRHSSVLNKTARSLSLSTTTL
jgi:DNA-binding XRE family transcriptional regulator